MLGLQKKLTIILRFPRGGRRMTKNQGIIRSGRVTTEGDDLFYEVRGQGSPLLMIAPAGGDGWQYSFVADILADEYKVICYDRRANGRSTMNRPQNFEISQQSRDALAVLHSAGETSALVFGNSSGAVIALDLAKAQPPAVRAAIVHEAPLPRLLPNAKRWQRFFAGVYSTAFRAGSSVAALQFMAGAQLPVLQLLRATKEVNLHRGQSPFPYLTDQEATEVLVKLELLPVTNYLPDVGRIKRNGTRVFVAVGRWGLDRKAWYTEAAQILAAQLGCEFVIFPGHHGSFMDMPVEFAAALRQVLHKAEEKDG
jgi:pimeloyl-ACP methyl ester carboxylesterase